MRFLRITGPLTCPANECAGCGASTGLSARPLRLVKTEVAALPGIVVGEESKAEVLVPVCEPCAPSLRRLRPTGAQYLVVWLGLAMLFFFVIDVPLFMTFPSAPSWLFPAPAMLAAIVMVAWYATRGPSYYQPLWLRVAERDECIVGVVRDAYAAKLHAANPGSKLGHAVRQRKLVSE